jgi:hypothetical protein
MAHKKFKPLLQTLGIFEDPDSESEVHIVSSDADPGFRRVREMVGLRQAPKGLTSQELEELLARRIWH